MILLSADVMSFLHFCDFDITSAARNGIFFIPLILILPRIFGIFGVEITQACADVLALMLTIPLAVSEVRDMKEDKEI